MKLAWEILSPKCKTRNSKFLYLVQMAVQGIEAIMMISRYVTNFSQALCSLELIKISSICGNS